jgi:hypothetical protein
MTSRDERKRRRTKEGAETTVSDKREWTGERRRERQNKTEVEHFVFPPRNVVLASLTLLTNVAGEIFACTI